jgi:hypothetical protein
VLLACPRRHDGDFTARLLGQMTNSSGEMTSDLRSEPVCIDLDGNPAAGDV